ncbi:MAG TPA: alpha/beta hydrolase [Anaerolineales bacterium]|nr:alpha/beta hydrolase [Anaerolineales bacterium]
MFTKRLFYVLTVVFLIVTACAPKSDVPESTPISVPSATAIATIIPQTVTATTSTDLKGKFEVNGHSLYIECLGTGSPTIVLETGEGGTVREFSQIKQKFAELTTTCAYDRANNGQSDKVATPRTAKDVIEDLHALLAAAEVPGPYLFVGHSAGGMFVQLYARTYPDQVIGVVAMNPVPPAHPWLDKVGDASEEAYYRGQNGESLDYLTSSDQIATAPLPPNVPFEMLLSTDIQCEGDQLCLKSYSTYEQIMQEVTAAWSNGKFSQVEAGHNIFSNDLDAVVAAVERVLASP